MLLLFTSRNCVRLKTEFSKMQEFRRQWRSQIGQDQMTYSLFWDFTYTCRNLPTFRDNLTTNLRCVKFQKSADLVYTSAEVRSQANGCSYMLSDSRRFDCDNRLWKFQFSGSVPLKKWFRTFRRIVKPSSSRSRRWSWHDSTKRRDVLTQWHCVASQRIRIFIDTAERTSVLTYKDVHSSSTVK